MSQGNDPHDFRIEKSRSYVKIGYSVRLKGGPVLKGAPQPEIMDFVTGFLQVIPGLETRLVGHSVGEKLSFTIPPEEAFGQREEALVFRKPISSFHFPEGCTPTVGMEIPIIINAENAPDTAVIREVDGDAIVVDLNHPLAGTTLQYEVEILEARPAKESDMCSEWESADASESCCSGAPTIILGSDDSPGDN